MLLGRSLKTYDDLSGRGGKYNIVLILDTRALVFFTPIE